MKLGNVVIVLGKRLVNNQLSAEGISRVEALAAKILEMPMENTALVFCGGKTQGQSISEADAMYAYFQTLNTSLAKPFPTSQILLENRSLNTFENMRNAAKVLCESGLFPLPSQATVEVILLSNAYHLERILEIQTLMDEQGLLRVIKSQCA
ncbi:YdcF family protein, partial [Vibrio sp. 1249-1]|uniref:YdcF family protein n=1 Tax=Vibrio sp. 1249-1 TaxID=3074547 RepID=UPI002964E2E2